MSDIESTPLAPLGARTRLTEADRAKVYELIGKHLDYLINGPGSYDPDGGRKSPQATAEDVGRLNGQVMALKGFVDDTASILDSVTDRLDEFRRGINAAIARDEGDDRNTLAPVPPPDDNVINPDAPGQYPMPRSNTALIRAPLIRGTRSFDRARAIRYVSGIADQK